MVVLSLRYVTHGGTWRVRSKEQCGCGASEATALVARAGQRHRKFPGQVPSPSAARRAGLSTMNYGIKCGVVKNGKILCCIK